METYFKINKRMLGAEAKTHQIYDTMYLISLTIDEI